MCVICLRFVIGLILPQRASRRGLSRFLRPGYPLLVRYPTAVHTRQIHHPQADLERRGSPFWLSVRSARVPSSPRFFREPRPPNRLTPALALRFQASRSQGAPSLFVYCTIHALQPLFAVSLTPSTCPARPSHLHHSPYGRQTSPWEWTFPVIYLTQGPLSVRLRPSPPLPRSRLRVYR